MAVMYVRNKANTAWIRVAGGGVSTTIPVHGADDHSDIDTTTDVAALNDVLKWDGSNWVPGTAGDTTEFTFSIDTFAGTETDATQLIGTGTWVASGAMSFSATYSNEPGGMTALVTMTGTATGWSTLVIDPTSGPEDTVADTSYPTSPGDVVTFTLTQSADGSSRTDTVTFNNTIRYDTNANGQGALTDANCEAMAEVAGPSENLNQTVSNLPTDAGNSLHFAYPARLSTIKQVQMDEGFGFASASFAAGATTLLPDVQTVNLTDVDNSAGFGEAFEAITSRLTDLTDGSRDFKTSTGTTAVNYIFWGEVAVDSGADDAQVYTEANVEDNTATEPGQVASNSISSRSMIVNATASQHVYIAYPARLGALTSILIGGFESLGDFWWDAGSGTELAITNPGGYQENYYVYVSKNPGFTDPTTMVVSI